MKHIVSSIFPKLLDFSLTILALFTFPKLFPDFQDSGHSVLQQPQNMFISYQEKKLFLSVSDSLGLRVTHFHEIRYFLVVRTVGYSLH